MLINLTCLLSQFFIVWELITFPASKMYTLNCGRNKESSRALISFPLIAEYHLWQKWKVLLFHDIQMTTLDNPDCSKPMVSNSILFMLFWHHEGSDLCQPAASSNRTHTGTKIFPTKCCCDSFFQNGFCFLNPLPNDKFYTLPNWNSLQMTISNLWKWKKVLEMGWKHCGIRRNCSLRAISPFPTVFSKGLYCRHVKTRVCLGMG